MAKKKHPRTNDVVASAVRWYEGILRSTAKRLCKQARETWAEGEQAETGVHELALDAADAAAHDFFSIDPERRLCLVLLASEVSDDEMSQPRAPRLESATRIFSSDLRHAIDRRIDRWSTQR